MSTDIKSWKDRVTPAYLSYAEQGHTSIGEAVRDEEIAELRAALALAPAPSAPQPMSEHNTRFAIDGAIQYGREDRNKPPSDDHWLMEYWLIGQQLRELGKTGWDNVTPLDPAERVVVAPSAPVARQPLENIEQFEDWWEDCRQKNGGTFIGADYRHWAHKAWQARAALSAQAVPSAIPDGWQLVPKRATPKMIDATWDMVLDGISENTRNRTIWDAMLAAAPTPPTTGTAK